MVDADRNDETIGVVGAGIGGLAASAYLGAAGADVSVYERESRVGGVANRLESDGFRFDTGPSWYLIPEVFERFFEHFDDSPADHYELVELEPNYRVFWDDGDRADVTTDLEETAALFESYEAGAGDALRRYLEDAAEAYEIGMNRFVMANRTRFRDYLSLEVARSARGLTLLGSMDDHVRTYIDHPKLRQLLQYTLVFLGGSPHNTPSLYKLMSHVDLGMGVYYPQGGMYEVVEAMERVAQAQGVEIHTDAEVDGVVPRADGLAVSLGGDEYVHDRVVCNAPPASVERSLLPADAVDRKPDYWDDRTWGPSAFMLYLGVDGDVDPLEHHTLVLPTDWDPHFESIFEEPHWPEDPAYYVNVPSETDPSVAPEGCSTVVILVPIAPGLEDGPELRTTYRDAVLADLAATTGVDLRDRILLEELTAVSDYERRLDRPQGTALGLAHTLFQTGPMRPGHRAPGVDGLYYVGGDTNPGIGVPMCLLSGEHVAETIRADMRPTGVGRLLPF
ncbi:phytoene desaturase family protein [Natrarchaeobaculum sulfurireducens]|uniref:Phytoene dehydrogenase n=1 Tax=Natrarchaeobaculum sulfurireducens TaxID=2044521 RepID=A0A346PM51_9EURY|nr:phytoene desaturase family protein [Natrarchaeobaculum sulfurireducens]AXR76929.1 Phytoene dehydrogenase or related enzyme [Natrarchaeobaculum sulfurireducens]AXR80596.1 Phytoene dehydrogenase [Natrarchaeobaculum sulfurireducens]